MLGLQELFFAFKNRCRHRMSNTYTRCFFLAGIDVPLYASRVLILHDPWHGATRPEFATRGLRTERCWRTEH